MESLDQSEPAEHITLPFKDLKLIAPIQANVEHAGYSLATPIQSHAIPPILEGRDVLASAPTGTGKTAAFSLPMLQNLFDRSPKKQTGRVGDEERAPGQGDRRRKFAYKKRRGNGAGPRPIRGLVLCPTRELAIQISDSLDTYGHKLGLRHTTIFGGVSQRRQEHALADGVDIVVATPGRLMDLIEQGYVELDQVELLILDEADRMLDMGFIPPVRKIAAMTKPDRQTLMFSATVPPTIQKLVAELMREPVRVNVLPQESEARQIEQKILFVKREDKPDLLAHVVREHGINCGIVFSRTKHGADRVVKQLAQRGIKAVAIHGNKNQNQRNRALHSFKTGNVPLLIATDVAARGIDVDGVTHVVQYDLTHEPETYVHRIGRTGRAGETGVALSFCDSEERAHLRDIQKLLKEEIDVDPDHPWADGKQRVAGKPQGPSGAPKPKLNHPMAEPASDKAAKTSPKQSAKQPKFKASKKASGKSGKPGAGVKRKPRRNNRHRATASV